MNKTNSSEFYLTKDEWFKIFGSSWIRDSLCLFAILPINLFGFLFNMLSLFIFTRKTFNKKPLYTYLRAYTINCMLLNFLLIFLFTANSYRYIEFSYSNWIPAYYISYVYVPLLNIGLFYSSILDLCICIERNSQFITKFKRIFKFSSFKICLVLLLVTFLLNVHFFFANFPTYAQIKLDSTTNLTIYYSSNANFTTSLAGIVLTNTVLVLRDLICLLIQTILNIALIVSFKNQLNKKKKIVTSNPTEQSISKADRRLTLMVIIMFLIETVEHVLQNVSAVYFIFFYGYTSFIIISFSGLVISLKCFSNIFLFYNFNKLFKLEFQKLLKFFSK